MAQTVPIDAYLGANRSGLSIGATLYQLDGTTVHAAFSTSGWYEAPASSGAWHHAGLSLPDAGGVVAVGVSGTEYMRVAVEAAKPLASDYTAARAAALDNLDAAVSTRATPAQVNAEADTALADVGLTTTITGRIDAAITSRLASASYTAPDNSTISTINTKLGTPVSSVSADIAGVQSDTNDIQSRLPAALVGGRIDANVGAISSDATAADNLEAALDGTGGVVITAGLTGNVTGNLSGSVGSVAGSVASVTAGVSLADGAITAAKIAADAITAAKIADGAIDAATFAAGAITASAIATDAITDAKVASDVTIAAVTGAVGSVTGNVGGNVVGSVGSVVGAVGSVTAGVTVTTNNDKTGYGLTDGAITSAKFGAGAITATVIAADAIDADALAADAVAEIQNGLATAVDLATVDTVVDAILVDTAEIGVAGAGLTALATQASVNTIDDFLDTEIAAIKAKTDNLPTSPANEATLTTIASYLDTEVAAILAAVDTEVAAIKTVTDALPNGGALTTITNNVAAILADTGTDGVVLANNALTAAALATDAVTEIQSGLATATALTALSDKVGTPVGVSVSADVAAIKAETASIQSDTNDIQTQIGAAGAGLTAVASAANLATLTAYVDTEVAVIKAKTDNLPTDPADASDIAASLATITSYIDTEVASILAAVDTEIAAIKAKTDNLPASPAATGDIPGTAAIATAIFAVAVETGHDLTTVLRAIYAAIRGRSVADNGDSPTTITYYAPDNSTARITHTLTDTERTVA